MKHCKLVPKPKSRATSQPWCPLASWHGLFVLLEALSLLGSWDFLAETSVRSLSLSPPNSAPAGLSGKAWASVFYELCLSVCVFMHVCACVYGIQSLISSVLLNHYLIFWTQGLSLNLELSQDAPVFVFPELDLPGFLCGSWAFKLGSSCWSGKHITN